MVIDKLHSQYWLRQNLEDTQYNLASRGDNYIEAVKLASLKKAVSNFVTIVTHKDIPVKFSSGQQSKTDGSTVYISADTTEKSFDVIVGLALHEGSHIRYSPMQFFIGQYTDQQTKKIKKLPAHLWKVLSSKTLEQANKIGLTEIEISEIMFMLWNIIEDRRIDSIMYKNAPGYQPYYDRLYAHYFYSDLVDKSLLTDIFSEPTIDNYLSLLLNFINPNFNINALPQLDYLVKLIDVDNINRFDENIIEEFDSALSDVINSNAVNKTCIEWNSKFVQPAFVKLLDEILYTIFSNVNSSYFEGMEPEPDESDESDEQDYIIIFNPNNSMETNYDTGGKIRISRKALKDALRKQKRFISGNIDKLIIDNSELSEQVDALESSGAYIHDSGNDFNSSQPRPTEDTGNRNFNCPVIVIKNVNRQIMASSAFPYANKYGSVLRPYPKAVEAVKRGISMGSIMAHKLVVRNEDRTTFYPRQNTGRIDKRLMAELGFGQTNVFHRKFTDSFEPVHLHMSLDASGSMDMDLKWTNTIALAVALAYVSSKIHNFEISISLRASPKSGTALVTMIYDSRRDSFVKIKNLFGFLRPNGGTPEGLAFEATIPLILNGTAGKRCYFINISDGQPCAYLSQKGNFGSASMLNDTLMYQGFDAAHHTKLQVDKIRAANVEILSYFIGSGPSYETDDKQIFQISYGKHAAFINVNNIGSIVRTLNKLFLARDI